MKEFIKENWMVMAQTVLILTILLAVISRDSGYSEKCISWSQANFSWNPDLLQPNGSCGKMEQGVIKGDFSHDYFDCRLPDGNNRTMDIFKKCGMYAKVRTPN